MNKVKFVDKYLRVAITKPKSSIGIRSVISENAHTEKFTLSVRNKPVTPGHVFGSFL